MIICIQHTNANGILLNFQNIVEEWSRQAKKLLSLCICLCRQPIDDSKVKTQFDFSVFRFKRIIQKYGQIHRNMLLSGPITTFSTYENNASLMKCNSSTANAFRSEMLGSSMFRVNWHKSNFFFISFLFALLCIDKELK